jgi:hypothetical protein
VWIFASMSLEMMTTFDKLKLTNQFIKQYTHW